MSGSARPSRRSGVPPVSQARLAFSAAVGDGGVPNAAGARCFRSLAACLTNGSTACNLYSPCSLSPDLCATGEAAGTRGLYSWRAPPLPWACSCAREWRPETLAVCQGPAPATSPMAPSPAAEEDFASRPRLRARRLAAAAPRAIYALLRHAQLPRPCSRCVSKKSLETLNPPCVAAKAVHIRPRIEWGLSVDVSR